MSGIDSTSAANLCITIPTSLAEELAKELRRQITTPDCMPWIGELLALVEEAEKNLAPAVEPPPLSSSPPPNGSHSHDSPLISSTPATIIELATTAGMSHSLLTLPVPSDPISLGAKGFPTETASLETTIRCSTRQALKRLVSDPTLAHSRKRTREDEDDVHQKENLALNEDQQCGEEEEEEEDGNYMDESDVSGFLYIDTLLIKLYRIFPSPL